MGQWTLELGIRLNVLPHANRLPGNLQGRGDSTHTSQNPPWLLAKASTPPIPPHTHPRPQLRGWERGNAMCLLSLTPPVLFTWGSKHRKTLFTGSIAWPSPESFLKMQIPQKWILRTGFKVAYSESS